MRALMAQAIKASGLSRENVADRMGELLSEPISVHSVNAWLAESKGGHRFPAEYLLAFCAVTGDHELIRDAVQALGARLATPDDLLLAELGRVYRKRIETEKREQAMLSLLEGRR